MKAAARAFRDERRDQVDQRQGEIADMQALLSDPTFRRFMSRVIEYAGVMRSAWSPNAEVHKKAGMQEVGFWIIEELNEADPLAWVTMQHEQITAAKLKERA